MNQRDHFVACARSYLGVRFAHQGRNPATGLDCLGLLIATAEKAGICIDGSPPRMLDDRQYGHRPETEYLQATLERYLQPVAEAEVGDVLLLKIHGRPQHLALVSDYPAVGEHGMIHAYATARKVVEHRLDAEWRQHIHCIYRLPA